MENQDLLEALDFIDPGSLTYEEWTMVGMGLKQAGFPVTSWEQWSARDGGRYHRGECTRKWGSFHGNANPVTENSIFKLARDHGWAGPAGYALDWNDVIDAPAGRSDGVVVDPHWLDVQELAIPAEWDPADQLVRYLQALFEPEEHVAYVTESYLRDGRPAPTKGCWDRTAGQLIEELRHYGDIHKVVGDCDAAAGAWICFNPINGGRSNDNVTDYRHALVECDNLELEKQQAIISQLELPCAALVYSGGKSLHAIVRVNAPDYAEYRKTLQTRYAHLSSYCVKYGQRVKEGEIIGYSGVTGNVFGAHLHFEVILGGKRTNPLVWLDSDFTTASGRVFTYRPGEHAVQQPEQAASGAQTAQNGTGKLQVITVGPVSQGDADAVFAVCQSRGLTDAGLYKSEWA